MIQRIKRVLAATFLVACESLADDASQESVEAWDSVGHINLVLALEQEFNIRFSDEQLGSITNIESIARAVKQQQQQQAA